MNGNWKPTIMVLGVLVLGVYGIIDNLYSFSGPLKTPVNKAQTTASPTMQVEESNSRSNERSETDATTDTSATTTDNTGSPSSSSFTFSKDRKDKGRSNKTAKNTENNKDKNKDKDKDKDKDKEQDTKEADNHKNRDQQMVKKKNPQEPQKQEPTSTLTASNSAPRETTEEKDKNEGAPYTFKEWSRRLLRQPDFEETQRLMDHYQKNLVTNSMYYRLVDAMLEDPRLQINKYGVIALSIPNYRSFERLSQVMEEEPRGSSLYKKAKKRVSQYQQLNDNGLPVLKTVIRNSDSTFTQLLAMRMLEKSARRHLNTNETQDTDARGREQEGSDGKEATATNKYHFEGFEQLLEEIVTGGHNSELVNRAEQTLATLRDS